jgi:hypothetical protein
VNGTAKLHSMPKEVNRGPTFFTSKKIIKANLSFPLDQPESSDCNCSEGSGTSGEEEKRGIKVNFF